MKSSTVIFLISSRPNTWNNLDDKFWSKPDLELFSKNDDISSWDNSYSRSNPISLNWIGIAVVKIIDRNDDESIESLNEKLLFDNNEIKEFIQGSIKNFSYFIGGELPKFNIKENHDN